MSSILGDITCISNGTNTEDDSTPNTNPRVCRKNGNACKTQNEARAVIKSMTIWRDESRRLCQKLCVDHSRQTRTHNKFSYTSGVSCQGGSRSGRQMRRLEVGAWSGKRGYRGTSWIWTHLTNYGDTRTASEIFITKTTKPAKPETLCKPWRI